MPTAMVRNLAPDSFKLSRYPRLIWALSALLGMATIALAWFGGRATIEWNRATRLFVQSRVEQVSDRVADGLRREMAQAAALTMTFPSARYDVESAPALGETVGRVLKDYPYVAGFFSWSATRGTVVLLGPAERVNHRWEVANTLEVGEGARLVQYRPPAFASEVIVRAREFGTAFPIVFGVFTVAAEGREYQAVVRLLYPRGQQTYTGAIGFLVDLSQAESDYFPEAARRIAHDLGENSFNFDFFRANAPRVPPVASVFSDRSFPLRFQDSASTDVLEARVTFPVETWVVRTTARDDTLLAMANAGASRNLILVAIFTAAILVSLLLSVHAVRRSAEASALEAEFVSNVTHALKTPLTNIQLTAETLGRSRVARPERIKEYAEILSAESTRLMRLIDNLLGFARFRGRTGIEELAVSDVPELIDDAIRRLRPRLDALGFAVGIEMPGALPPVRVDRQAILHALDNILDNAIKYSPERKAIRIDVSLLDEAVCLKIADEGLGIPLEDRPRIFEKFYRGSNAVAEGSGLGLALTASIVRAHGGDITVSAGVTSGTVVTIRLPIAQDS